jgi:hypothetical protein
MEAYKWLGENRKFYHKAAISKIEKIIEGAASFHGSESSESDDSL